MQSSSVNIFKKIFSDKKSLNLSKDKSVDPSRKTIPKLPLYAADDLSFEPTPRPEIVDFDQLLAASKTLESLRVKLDFRIDAKQRAKIWRYLLGYLSLRAKPSFLEEKRSDYLKSRKRLEINADPTDRQLKEILKMVENDVERTFTGSPIFARPEVRLVLKNVLSVYSQRHPSTGYSQGMNDICAPILCVFLAEAMAMTLQQLEQFLADGSHALSASILQKVEADTYFCLSLFLTRYISHFSKGFSGVNDSIKIIEKNLPVFDAVLSRHFEQQKVSIRNVGFRMVYCFLLREFPLMLTPVLIDFYLADTNAYLELCPYLIIALMMRFSSQLKQLKTEKLILFVQAFPVGDWTEEKLRELLTEALALRKSTLNSK